MRCSGPRRAGGLGERLSILGCLPVTTVDGAWQRRLAGGCNGGFGGASQARTTRDAAVASTTTTGCPT